MQLTSLGPTTLHMSAKGLEAKLVSAKTERFFTHEQISYGVLGDLPHQALLAKINALATYNLAVFPFPKENPSELWIFEAVPMAAAAIFQGKKALKQSDYSIALKQFKTAIKLQRQQKGETADLEKAIHIIQQKKGVLKWKQAAPLYLPNEKEIKRFEGILTTYEGHADMSSCFADLIAIAEPFRPHHYWMKALVCEKQKKGQEAVAAYLALAQDNPHALACINKAHALATKDRQEGVRMAFEKAVMQLSAASTLDAPTCFICFNEEEKDVCEWLEKTFVSDLDLAGIKPIICLQKLGPGQDASSFHELARHADLVLIVCTPQLKEKYIEREKVHAGLAQELRIIKERYRDKNKANSIFPIIAKGTREQALPAAYFEPITSVQFSIKSFDFNYLVQAFELFAAMRRVPHNEWHKLFDGFIQGAKLTLQGKVDPRQVALWELDKKQRMQALPNTIQHRIAQLTKMANLPLPPQDFTGREEELKNLHALCCQTHRVAITGLGGVGKTALALQYANCYQTHYAWIHFMPAGTPQVVIDGLLKLADALWVPKSDKIEERLLWLKTFLDRQERECLLIFDGVDTEDAFEQIKKYLPDRGRCLLLTSRLIEHCHLLNFYPLALAPLAIEAAVHYLLLATRTSDQKAAQTLAQKLGRLPLALTHAAGYIRRRCISVEYYCQQFDRYQLELFESEKLIPGSDKQTILTTWQMSMDAIVKIHKCPLSQGILAFLAFLAQSAIPLPLLQAWFKIAHPKKRELNLDDAIAYLCDYSMLSRASSNSYHVHVLVQQVTKYQLNLADRQRTLSHALQACLAMIPCLDYEALQARRQLDPFMPHFRAITQYTAHPTDLPFMLTLLKRIWEFDCKDGRYQDLEHIARICLEFSTNQDEKIEHLKHLGLSLHHMGKYAEALRYFKEALYIANKGLGEKHLNVAKILGNMGLTLGELGQHQEALAYHMHALELRKELLGEKHPGVAGNLDNVGTALGNLDQHEEALKYHMQALKMRKELLGEKHSDVARSLHNLGSALGNLGQHREALKYKMQALELGKELLGDKHPNMEVILSNVGLALVDLGQHQEAIKYYMQALELRKKLLGDKHPNILASLHNVVTTLVKLGQYREALPYHIQALELRKKLLGDKHPDILASLHNVVTTLVKLGQYREALPYHIQALKLKKELLEDKLIHVTTSLYNVGTNLKQLGQHQEALKFQMRALQVKKELLEDKLLHVKTNLGNLVSTLDDSDQYPEVLKHQTRLLELKKELVGDKRYVKCQTRASELVKELLGNKRYDVAASLSNEESTLSKLDQHQEAFKCQTRASELVKELLEVKHHDVVSKP